MNKRITGDMDQTSDPDSRGSPRHVSDGERRRCEASVETEEEYWDGGEYREIVSSGNNSSGVVDGAGDGQVNFIELFCSFCSMSVHFHLPLSPRHNDYGCNDPDLMMK